MALNGPQAGVGECPSVEVPGIKQLCGDLGTDLDIYQWPLCSFCSYWKGNRNESLYLEHSEWLAKVACLVPRAVLGVLFCCVFGFGWFVSLDRSTHSSAGRLVQVNNDRFRSPGGLNETYRQNMIALNK